MKCSGLDDIILAPPPLLQKKLLAETDHFILLGAAQAIYLMHLFLLCHTNIFLSI